MNRRILPGLPRTLLLALLASGSLSCVRAGPPASPRPGVDALAVPPLPLPWPEWEQNEEADAEQEPDLTVRLREAPAGTRPVDGAAPEPGAGESVVLPPERTERLLSRLPPLPAPDTGAFRFPVATPPPPRTGRLVLTSFPPPDTSARPRLDPAEAPLRVVRIVPSGAVELAPHVTITFSEPMVPLTTVAGTESRMPPARLTPELPGRWSWIDPRTLRFEPEGRFPMATSFEVEVPAGTRPVRGRALEQTVRSTFATPAPRAIGAYPALDPDLDPDRIRSPRWSGDPVDHGASWVKHHPIVVIAFDQPVEPTAVIGSLRMLADGAAAAVRMALPEEIERDSVVRALVGTLETGRWLAVRPVEPLPAGADVRVVLDPGVPSLEGPLATTRPQVVRFLTYGPLHIAAHQCGMENCRPGEPWIIRLTNPVDPDEWSAGLVQVEPALPDMTIIERGAEILIQGTPRANTTYQVTLAPSVRDRFGQTLEGSQSVTFTTDAPAPVVSIPGAPFIVMDPDGPSLLTVRSVGHPSLRVRVYRVTTEQWTEWGPALAGLYGRSEFSPPGDLVTSTVLDVTDQGAEVQEAVVDIGPALRDGLGHAIVVVESADTVIVPGRQPHETTAYAWVQSTRIGLSASVDAEDLYVWASSLRTGEPLAGVDVMLRPAAQTSSTALDGSARLPLTRSGDYALIAAGADTAMLPANPYRFWGGRWQRRPPGRLRWQILTDRGLYRPGETVHLKGWVRHTGDRSSGLRLAHEVDSIAFTMLGPRSEELHRSVLLPGALGGFSSNVELPLALNLGQGLIQVDPYGAELPHIRLAANHSFQVQEFRRPDYEVRVTADPGPYIVGDVIDVMLNAEYYGGGGLGKAPVNWQVMAWPGVYSPPGWDRWHFGRFTRWWGSPSREPEVLRGETDAAGSHRLLIDLLSARTPFPISLSTNAQVHDVNRQIGSGGVAPIVHPAALTAGLRTERAWLRPRQPAEIQIIVVDHDGRVIAGREVDVALEHRGGRWWDADARTAESAEIVCRIVSAAEPVSCPFSADSSGMYVMRADVRDTDGRLSRSELMIRVAGAPGAPDPQREPGSFELVADRDEYQPGDTARILVQPPFYPAEAVITIRREGMMDTRRQRIETPVYELKLPIGDEHIGGVHVRVDVVDAERGVNYGFGSASIAVPPYRRALDVEISARDTLAAPGDEVMIDIDVRDAVGRPAANAEVAVWMVDEAILALGNYSPPDPLAVFYALPRSGVEDSNNRQWVVHWPRSAGPRTVSGFLISAFGRGGAVADATVRLVGTDIEVHTAWDGSFTLHDVAPGDHTLEITATNGMSGRRTITVPEDGVHLGNLVLGAGGLTGVHAAGYMGRQDSAIALASVVVTGAPMNIPPPAKIQLRARVEAGMQPVQQDVDVRTEFTPLAFFEPSLRTDGNGHVQVTTRLPQSLTRYRIMAVAVHGAQQFGTGEAALTTRKDLMVRVAAPRFLNHGDTFELPVLLQNMSSRALTVDVAARAAGVDVRGTAGRTLSLGPGARAEVRFDVAAPLPGTAHVQVVAVTADGTSDAAGQSIPVHTPATVEAFAAYGSVDDDTPVSLPLARPRDVIEMFGGLEVSITSTALHALTDAVLYLCIYPFSGSEHIASRVIAIAALRDVLSAFGAVNLPSADVLVAQTRHDIVELSGRQHWDGGWPMWSGRESHPFVSLHVAHALQRAREKGFDIPEQTVQGAARYLSSIGTQVEDWPFAAQQSAGAYALYVRHRMGDTAAVREARLMAADADAPGRVDGVLPIEAAGWLLHVLAADPSSHAQAAELRRVLLNRLTETAGTVTFAEHYEDAAHLLFHSTRRTDAVVLEALIAAGADADIVTRLAHSLLAHRKAGRWSGTQENSWVLLALDRYFRTYEATTPSFDSRVWLGRQFAGEHEFEGRTTDRQHIDIPMRELLRTDAQDLVIAREGNGRMYYRAGLRYAPVDSRTPPVDRGFEVTRAYEAVDDPADVTRDEDGTWRVRAGARVRVRVGMVAPSVRYHAALIDPLPAGFEPLNAALRGTGFADDPDAPTGSSQWWRRAAWIEHENLRDDRAEAFASLLPAGVHEYTYLARATTPGRFVVPPPRAEMMYHPETFGRGIGHTVVIEER